MKIAVCSDIHLEFGEIKLANPGDVDVLILSGDICVARHLMAYDDPMPTRESKEFHEFFYNCANEFPFVVYVAGNHEHYGGDYKYTLSTIKQNLKYLPNIQVLDKETWILHDDVAFIGGTLWTDMNKEDPVTLYQIKGYMNDFRTIKNSNRMITFKHPKYKTDDEGKYVYENDKLIEIGMTVSERVSTFCPEDSVEDHKQMLEHIRKTYDELPLDMRIVVVGHHAPSKASTHPRYKDEVVTNGAYSSDLSEFILDRPRIKLWTHGHTHEVFDYMIGSTRIVCNPRGYIHYEERADQFELKVVEI